ncbi:hypothetical protein ACFE04_002782 [Oxalis oulophora]
MVSMKKSVNNDKLPWFYNHLKKPLPVYTKSSSQIVPETCLGDRKKPKIANSKSQSLSTSTFIGENLFAIFIVILGLILFAQLIGNMQTYLQSLTTRVEEWRLKRRDIEQWMRHRQLPSDLQDRVRQFVHYKWLATRGVDGDHIIRTLPKDLRRDIQHHLCLDLIRRVSNFPRTKF